MAQELQKLSPEELKALREQLKKDAEIAVNNQHKKEDFLSLKGETGGKNITVIVSPDKMTASVLLAAPSLGETYTVPEVVAALRSNKVVVGFKSEEIKEYLEQQFYDVPFFAARGTEMEKGIDGYFEFLVDMATPKKPEIREDGTVDYSAMGKLANVSEGDVIAVYHPAVQGKKGVNVVGEELIPKFAKEQTPLRGKYIEYNEETREYRAKLTGKISCINNNVEILTVHEVHGDVDMSIGKVEFFGDIIIYGNVEQGVTIRAGRNITINGSVAGAKITAGGDIIVNKGILGNNKGKIAARGSVCADFIEYTIVDAGMDVQANYILNSEVNANGRVKVLGSRGMIIGGNTHGLLGIESNHSGNESEPKTFLHVGLKQEDYQNYMVLMTKQRNYASQIQSLVEEISRLLNKAREQGVTKEEKEKIINLRNAKDEMYQTLSNIEKEKKEMAAKMSIGANASIIIHKIVHINTIIGIDASVLKITRDDGYARYVIRNDVIERFSTIS